MGSDCRCGQRTFRTFCNLIMLPTYHVMDMVGGSSRWFVLGRSPRGSQRQCTNDCACFCIVKELYCACVAMLAQCMLSFVCLSVRPSVTRRYCQLYSFNLHDIFSGVWRQHCRVTLDDGELCVCCRWELHQVSHAELQADLLLSARSRWDHSPRVCCRRRPVRGPQDRDVRVAGTQTQWVNDGLTPLHSSHPISS